MYNLFPRLSTRYNARFFSRLHQSPPRKIDKRLLQFTTILGKETSEPIWPLVSSLLKPKRALPLSEALHEHGLPVDQYAFWKPILNAKDLDHAFEILRSSGPYTSMGATYSEGGIDAVSAQDLPSWLIVHMIIHGVRTATQASLAVQLVSYHLSSAPASLQPSLLVLCAVTLARFNAILQLTVVVRAFLSKPVSYPSLHFNLLLQAISYFSPSAVAADQVVILLDAMSARGLHLRSRTYHALLADRFVTLQLTKMLQARMIRQGVPPDAAYLEAYLRIFSKNGVIHDAKNYAAAIHSLQGDANTPVSMEASTLSLAAFHNDRNSAFAYLTRLLRQDKTPPAVSSPVSCFKSSPKKVTTRSARRRIIVKRSVDVYDWTTALAVAARDRSTSASTLVRLFERATERTLAFRPTVVTYTVILRGLLHRHAFAEAQRIWARLVQLGLSLDSKALSAGLQLLTRSEKPHEAFSLLEANVGRVKLNIITINSFLASLRRIGRPDVVFALWDAMEKLYQTQPDAVTLSILLDSSRLAVKLDDTVSGALAHLASKNPFRKSTPASPPNRTALKKEIERMLGNDEHGPRTYVSGMWHGAPAWERALAIFQRVVIINISAIEGAHSPMLVPSSVPKYSLHSIPESNLQIALTDACFLSYLLVLGLRHRASDIPLTLAWMRQLGITPDKDTLSVALVFWAETTLRAPLMERLAGGRERSAYAGLIRWMAEWVGAQCIPTEREVGIWVRKVERMRETRF